MPVVMFHKQDIKGKDGREWVKISAIGETGETVEIFLAKSEFDAFELPSNVYATPTQLKEIFANLPQVDVAYNSRGRVVSIKA